MHAICLGRTVALQLQRSRPTAEGTRAGRDCARRFSSSLTYVSPLNLAKGRACDVAVLARLCPRAEKVETLLEARSHSLAATHAVAWSCVRVAPSAAHPVFRTDHGGPLSHVARSAAKRCALHTPAAWLTPKPPRSLSALTIARARRHDKPVPRSMMPRYTGRHGAGARGAVRVAGAPVRLFRACARAL